MTINLHYCAFIKISPFGRNDRGYKINNGAKDETKIVTISQALDEFSWKYP